jgi:hypothetical protein
MLMRVQTSTSYPLKQNTVVIQYRPDQCRSSYFNVGVNLEYRPQTRLKTFDITIV